MLGVGIDIVEVARIRKAIERWGERFLSRILTEGEVQDCRQRGHFFSSVAARFAAKEAFAKAVPGGHQLGWHQFSVRNAGTGRPIPHLGEKARKLVGDRRVHVSLSHTDQYATAVVIIE